MEGTGLAMNTIPPNDFGHFEMLDALVQLEPAEALDTELAGQFAAIGIVKGEKFAPDARLRTILDDAAAVGNAASRTLGMGAHPTDDFRLYDGDTAWWNMLWVGGFEFTNPPPMITPDGVKPFPDKGARQLHGRTSFFYTATGVSPAMCMRLTNVGSQYLVANVDADGEPLNGAKTYRLDAAEGHPGGSVLVAERLRQPDSFAAADRPALSTCRQPDVPLPRRRGRAGRLHRHLLLAVTAGRRRGRQLDPDRPGQGLVHHPAPLQPAAAVLRQDLATGRDRARALTSSLQRFTRVHTASRSRNLQDATTRPSMFAQDQSKGNCHDRLAIGDPGPRPSRDHDCRVSRCVEPRTGRTLMVARVAALVAVDAPPISYLLNLEAASEVGIDAETVRGVLAAIAPIVGTARIASATGKIATALEVAIEVAELDDEDDGV